MTKYDGILLSVEPHQEEVRRLPVQEGKEVNSILFISFSFCPPPQSIWRRGMFESLPSYIRCVIKAKTLRQKLEEPVL